MQQHGHSYLHGVGTAPLMGCTLGDRLRELAGQRPEGLALVDCAHGVRWTWQALDHQASVLAAAFLDLGLVPGDRVALWLMNRAEWTLSLLAAARVGMIAVNINPGARRGEVQRFLNQVQARALIIQPAFKTSDYLAMVQELLSDRDRQAGAALQAAAVPDLRQVIQAGEEEVPGMHRFAGLLESASPQARAQVDALSAAVDFDDPVNIQFSNATGGEAAGTTLTHHNILNNGAMVGRTLHLGPEDRVCIPVPLFHCFGMVMGNMACLAHGSTMVYPGEAFDPAQTLEAVQAEGCTALYGVPAMFKAMLEQERFADFDLSTLRTGIMAGAPCPPETMDQVMTRMHMDQVTIAYGMTESSPVSFMSDVDDPVDRRLNTVGTLRPHLEAKIIDGEGCILPRGEAGELCVRGYSVMRGYWNDAQLTRRVIDEAGWLHTGDLACLDEDGYCRIVGGVKDVIIRGGENIYPREIEDFLTTHPQIAEAVVVGVPDARLGETVCACVRVTASDLTPEAVQAFCRGEIAHYKIPAHVRLYERFPRSTGRALRFMLKDESLEALGLGQDTAGQG
ncbi:AMP-binding protein [Ectothiorhodospira mobilis]|uniref:AMP-binding protein n=1 Tax=Ectothiorhodospira mobilis TaxID=195064 RepID=UPI001905281B|nr:AMP-binding protein [Ectothiorhodospira mobilis]MBK1692346.1 AMP-binding protein [Ectothiorhodospira mobilis]